jgi:hypothetical protein
MLTFCNSYVLWLLVSSYVYSSNSYVKWRFYFTWCYVLQQYHWLCCLLPTQSVCSLLRVSAPCSECLLTAQSVCLLLRVSAFCSECLLSAQSVYSLFRVSVPCSEYLLSARSVCSLLRVFALAHADQRASERNDRLGRICISIFRVAEAELQYVETY